MDFERCGRVEVSTKQFMKMDFSVLTSTPDREKNVECTQNTQATNNTSHPMLTPDAKKRFGLKPDQTTHNIPLNKHNLLRPTDFISEVVPDKTYDGTSMILAQQRHILNEKLRTRGAHPIEWKATEDELLAA